MDCRLIVATVVALAASPASAREPMRDTDFLAGFRDLAGQEVTIDKCVIGGTTSGFIRCEDRNGAASWALDAATMDKGDLAYAFGQCPTGSRKLPACSFVVRGVVKNSTTPWLLNAKFVR